MKIAIINDTHFGARNDSHLFLEHFLSFFENQFFPYLKENDIKTIFHLGDLLDRRKFVNFHTLSYVKNRFFKILKDNNIEMHMILGNHDTYYKNTNEVNSPKELFQEYKNFYLYEEPQNLIFDNIKFCMIPWICEENENKIMNFIKNTDATILCGHLELNGYEVMRGVAHIGGMEDESIQKFDKVFSGHFHSKSSSKNVKYLGTQYQITFSDVNDMKGFHVFDTQTEELEFIENKNKMFYIIHTEDKYSDYSFLNEKFVKLMVNKNTQRNRIDDIIYEIEKNNPYDLTIIEEYNIDNIDETAIDLSKDTMTIISEEIDSLELDLDKGKLKKLSNEIYLEALNQ